MQRRRQELTLNASVQNCWALCIDFAECIKNVVRMSRTNIFRIIKPVRMLNAGSFHDPADRRTVFKIQAFAPAPQLIFR